MCQRLERPTATISKLPFQNSAIQESINFQLEICLFDTVVKNTRLSLWVAISQLTKTPYT